MPFARIHTATMLTHGTVVRAAVARLRLVRLSCSIMALLLAFALLLTAVCSVGEAIDVCDWRKDVREFSCLRKVMNSVMDRLDERVDLKLPGRSGVKNGVNYTVWKFHLTGVTDFSGLRLYWKKDAIPRHPVSKDLYVNMTLEWPKVKLEMNAEVRPCLNDVCSSPLYAQPEISFDIARFTYIWGRPGPSAKRVKKHHSRHVKSLPSDGIVRLHVDSSSYRDNIRLNPATIVRDEAVQFGPRENRSTKAAVYQAWWDYQHAIAHRLLDMMKHWFEEHVLPTLDKTVRL